jgi:hypothetical protein
VSHAFTASLMMVCVVGALQSCWSQKGTDVGLNPHHVPHRLARLQFLHSRL